MSEIEFWHAAAAPKKPTAPVLIVRKRAFAPAQAPTPAAARKPPPIAKKPATAAKPGGLASDAKPKKATPGPGLPKPPKATGAGKKPAKAKAKTAAALLGAGAEGQVEVRHTQDRCDPVQAASAIQGATGVFAEMEAAEGPEKRKAGAAVGMADDVAGELPVQLRSFLSELCCDLCRLISGCC